MNEILKERNEDVFTLIMALLSGVACVAALFTVQLIVRAYFNPLVLGIALFLTWCALLAVVACLLPTLLKALKVTQKLASRPVGKLLIRIEEKSEKIAYFLVAAYALSELLTIVSFHSTTSGK